MELECRIGLSWAAVTKYHSQGGLNNKFPIVWRLEVQGQGVGSVGFTLRHLPFGL